MEILSSAGNPRQPFLLLSEAPLLGSTSTPTLPCYRVCHLDLRVCFCVCVVLLCIILSMKF